jgi:hypothetical protein
MATSTTKHKLTGNQQPQAFALEVVLLETAKQLGNYAHAQGKYESAVKDRDNAKAVIDRLIPQLHKHGVKLGELPRTGADIGYKGVKVTPAQALSVGVYNAMPADLSHAVKKNYLSALRVCIESNHKFTLNPARDRTKGAKDSTKDIVAQKMPKPEDQKPSAVKQSLADVIRANFKTLLANNPQLAQELAEELAELAGV